MFFCLIYVFIVTPYLDLDAFMHHALHVLDASALQVTYSEALQPPSQTRAKNYRFKQLTKYRHIIPR